MTSSIPAGFAPIATQSPFIQSNGPIYRRADGSDLHLGLLIEERHCNGLGSIHGGMLATLTDFAMGYALARQRNTGQGVVSLSLNLEYIGAARAGTWLDMHVQIKKEAGSVVFAVCEICAGAQVVVTASGVYKFIAPRTAAD